MCTAHVYKILSLKNVLAFYQKDVFCHFVKLIIPKVLTLTSMKTNYLILFLFKSYSPKVSNGNAVGVPTDF